MSTAISVYHGAFGRAGLYRLDKPMIKHAHREGHLIFWVGGEGGLNHVNGTPCTISRECGVAINPWEIHDYEPVGGDLNQWVLVLYIKPGWFDRLSDASVRSLEFGRPWIEITAPLQRLVDRVVGVMTSGQAMGLLDGYLFDLTAESFAQTHQARLASARSASRFIDFRVKKSIRLMTERVGALAHLTTVAQQSGLSRPHFFKLFRDQLGVTPKLFWNTIRMERALADLASGPKSITDISFDLGFSSQSSFSRFFTLNTGLSPTDYRRVARVLNG